MKNKTLAIISHTPHYKTENKEIKGFSSTVKEINHLATIFKSIIHIAPLYQTPCPPNTTSYKNNP